MIITPQEAQKKLRTQADRAFRGLVLEAGKRIIFRTPVDTGRARSNWHTSIDRPVFTADEPPGDDNGDQHGPATDEAIRELIHYGNGADSGDVVYICNGLPYILVLERGRVDNKGSIQAPHGMVKVTIAELKEVAKAVAAKVRAMQ